MSLQQLIETYGYAIVLIGAFLEGETIVVLAGFAAHQGHLNLPWVMLTALVGSFLGDQFYFFIGRRFGRRIIAKYPTWSARTLRAQRLLERFQSLFILVQRFLYGLRVAGPMAIGISEVSAIKFVSLNMVSAMIWAGVIAGAGYLFGDTVEFFLKDVRQIEELIFAMLAAVGAVLWGAYWWRERRRRLARRNHC